MFASHLVPHMKLAATAEIPAEQCSNGKCNATIDGVITDKRPQQLLIVRNKVHQINLVVFSPKSCVRFLIKLVAMDNYPWILSGSSILCKSIGGACLVYLAIFVHGRYVFNIVAESYRGHRMAYAESSRAMVLQCPECNVW